MPLGAVARGAMKLVTLGGMKASVKLWTRGASSLTSRRPSFVTNISTVSSPTTSSFCRMAETCAFTVASEIESS